MRTIFAALTFVFCSQVFAQSLFIFEDVKGDDHGWGEVNYPVGGKLRPGDLDILSVEAEDDGDSVTFSVKFKNKIDSPEGVYGDDTGQPISSYVREAFYKQNIDIYINTHSDDAPYFRGLVPGRNARLPNDKTWNKAIVVTPRPAAIGDVITQQLVRKLKKRLASEGVRVPDEDSLEDDIQKKVLPNFYFPSRSRVYGRKLKFSVPKAFLGGTPQKNWEYLVVVTGADVETRGSLPFMQEDEQPVFMRPVVGGGNGSTFGGMFRANAYTPHIIDVLIPTDKTQEQLLSLADENTQQFAVLPMLSPEKYPGFDMPDIDASFRGKGYAEYDPWSALDRSPHATRSSLDATSTNSIVISPAERKESSGAEKEPSVSNHTQTLSEKALNPYSEEQAKKENFNPSNRPPLERLKELETLREEGKISEKEYDELRRRIIMSI